MSEDEFIPVKGTVFGKYKIRVTHQVAEQLKKNPQLLAEFIKAMEQDVKEHPERHPDNFAKNVSGDAKSEMYQTRINYEEEK